MEPIEELLRALAAKGLTLGSVESITAGLFGATAAEIPGASNVYKGGLITYTAELKNKLAFVPSQLIQDHGVVSAEVAASMAVGGQKALGVDVCLSCTGNAGPTAEKGSAPVGAVYLGLAYGGNVWTVPLNYEGERNFIRKKTAEAMGLFGLSIFGKKE
jgi:PncC family amidohydrolase